MKIQIDKENLLSGIQVVQNVVTPKMTLPILSNILLEAHKGNLHMVATDLDIGISCHVNAGSIEEEGAITVPANRFSDIIRELPAGNITIVARKNNMVTVDCQNCQFKLMGLPKEEFPKLPEFKDKEVVAIEQSLLKKAFNLTSFAVSHEETRYILNGTLYKIKDETLTVVATDGRRLALSQQKLSGVKNREMQMIIPFKTIQELNRNLKDEGEVSFASDSNQVLFDLNGIIIISRLIEGEFPDWQQVIPPAAENKIKVKREIFLSAIKRAALLSTLDYQAVKLEVFKNKLVISKATPDVGESREEIPAEYSGKELAIGFNPTYIMDVLKNLEDETINFEITETDKPGVIRSDGYTYIVLPMRLG